MQLLELDADGYRALLNTPAIGELLGSTDALPLLVVRGPVGTMPVDTTPAAGALPVIVCYVGDGFGGRGPACADLVVGEDDIGPLALEVARAPVAATSLAVHLRTMPTGSVEAGLATESAVYSTLLAGSEFRAWRTAVPPRPVEDERPTVTAERDGRLLHVRLHRPHRHNAINARLRDELHDVLTAALFDPDLDRVVLSGDGASFCSGGDLAEFGTSPDPATGHVIRVLRSPGRRLHQLGHRVEARIHGVTFGGGIEMAAFAPRVIAHPDTRIALPELSLGLIPGAGGTVSISRRVGTQRLAALALTGREIGAQTALEWGLVDEIRPNAP